MFRKYLFSAAALATSIAFPAISNAQPGVNLPGAGAVQGGMAGASTAAPIDAIGALFWNPAAIGRLGRQEVSIGGAFVYPDISVSSSLPSLRGGVAAGTTRSDNGFPLVPSIGMVFQLEEGSPLTLGFGLLALGGGGVNFPGDANNPILAPTGPLNQLVLGPVFSNIQILQMNPTASYQVNDRLVLGAGPTVDITSASFDEAFFGPINRVPGAPNNFSSATNSRPYWGGGGRVGLVYSMTDAFDAGFGYTTKQWLETWKFNARDNLGNAQTLSLKASLPAIYSLGFAYRGIERLTLALDLRYFDYKNTELFGVSTADGGLGWDSAFATAIGANYQLTDRLAVRAGYQHNTNPLENTSTLFNIQAPAIIQDTFTLGATMALTESVSFSLGYAYGFQNSITGTARQFPNANISFDASSHSLLFNMQVKFGGGCAKHSCPAATYESLTPTAQLLPPVAGGDTARDGVAANPTTR